MKIETQEISLPILKEKKINLFIKRIDQIHEHVSGNKWYKLKYNIIEAKRRKTKSILTFGGAYSNHISATAYLAKENGFDSIGIIRGEEHVPLNPTLNFAVSKGMNIHYISRRDYKLKHTPEFLKSLRERFDNFYLIPEGGSNQFALKGCSEIIDINDTQDYICCAVGTGSTIAGVINSLNVNQRAVGFSAINDLCWLRKNISEWTTKKNWEILNNYCGGGYAKINQELVDFIDNFYKTQGVGLDVVYTGKMMFGILDLVAKDFFPKGSSILALHTGGLQGNKGMNHRFKIQLPVC